MMPTYDGSVPAEGKSKEMDAIARAAATKYPTDRNARVNDQDPTNDRNTVAGNPDDAQFSRTAKIGPGGKD